MRRARLVVLLPAIATILAVALGVWLVRRPAAPSAVCGEAIAPVTAQAVFDRLKTIAAPDGCTLDAVDTHKDTMNIRFARLPHGSAPPPGLTVAVKSCTSAPAVGNTFAYQTPPELAAACPSTMSAVNAAFEGSDFGGTVVLASTTSSTGFHSPQLSKLVKVALTAAVVALFTLVGALWFARKRRPLPRVG